MEEITEEKNKANELKLLHQALLLDESEVVSEGIERLKEIGNADSLSVLATMLCGEKDFGNDINQQIILFLNTIKLENGIDVLVTEITKYLNKRNAEKLLQACWEINYDCSKHLVEFAEIAANANALQLVECMSIFENIENTPAVEDVLQSLKIIDKALELQNDTLHKSLLFSCRESIFRLS